MTKNHLADSNLSNLRKYSRQNLRKIFPLFIPTLQTSFVIVPPALINFGCFIYYLGHLV